MKKLTTIVSMVFVLLLCQAAIADGSYTSGDHMGSGTIFRTATVLAKNINMRDQASFDGKVVVSIPGGAELDIVSEYGEWLQANYIKDGRQYSGWIVRDYVVQNPMKLILREGNVPAYAAPTMSAKKVGSLNVYTELTVIGTWDTYYIVSLRDASAFIHKNVNAWTDLDMSEYAHMPYLGSVRTLRETTLRSGPADTWARADTVKAGTTLDLVSKINDNGFYAVRYRDGWIAYISAKDVEMR